MVPLLWNSRFIRWCSNFKIVLKNNPVGFRNVTVMKWAVECAAFSIWNSGKNRMFIYVDTHTVPYHQLKHHSFKQYEETKTAKLKLGTSHYYIS